MKVYKLQLSVISAEEENALPVTISTLPQAFCERMPHAYCRILSQTNGINNQNPRLIRGQSLVKNDWSAVIKSEGLGEFVVPIRKQHICQLLVAEIMTKSPRPNKNLHLVEHQKHDGMLMNSEYLLEEVSSNMKAIQKVKLIG